MILFSNFKEKYQLGYTLMELLVVIAIIAVMSTISLFNYDELGKNVELGNDGYLLALRIREAQVYGVNKKARTSGAIEFGENYSYGLYFNIDTQNPVTEVNKGQFIMYIDGLHDDCSVANDGGNPKPTCVDGFNDHGSDNCIASSTVNECVSKMIFNRGNTIKSLSIQNKSGGG